VNLAFPDKFVPAFMPKLKISSRYEGTVTGKKTKQVICSSESMCEVK
jgi:hypothetical protein